MINRAGIILPLQKSGRMIHLTHKKRYFLFIFFCAALPTGLGAQWTNVPLEHWAYDFIDRMQIRGLIDTRFQTRPYARREVGAMLEEMESRLSETGATMCRAEAALFEQLKGEFSDVYSGAVEERFRERHFFDWSEGKSHASGDALLGERAEYRNGDAELLSSNTTFGGRIRVDFSDHFSVQAAAWNTLRKGDDLSEEQFNPSQGIPVVISGRNAYSDDADAVMTWNPSWFRIEFGRDRAHWGPGRNGSLLLSMQGGRFEMLRLLIPFHRFRFSSIHGKLHSGIGEKYLSAHRLEFRVARWLILAASESVVYGGRSPEPAYLNPFMPYHVAEHHLGDRDNNAMSLDITCYPGWRMKAYAELFIDDYTTSENPFTYYGNKWALLTGLSWVAPFGLSPADIRLEYARIEPFVYTHKDPVNPYTNYDFSLGHWLGPDSDGLSICAAWLFSRRLSASVAWEQTRRGEGDLTIPHDSSMGKEKEFLSGICETRKAAGFAFSLQPFKDLFLCLNYCAVWTRNAGHEAGLHSFGHLVRCTLTFDY